MLTQKPSGASHLAFGRSSRSSAVLLLLDAISEGQILLEDKKSPVVSTLVDQGVKSNFKSMPPVVYVCASIDGVSL